MALCLRDDCVRVADGDGHEFHLSPHHFEGGDEWGVLSGLLLKPLVASKVMAESDLDENEVALLALESARIRRRNVRYFSGVHEVGGGAVSRLKKNLLGLEGKMKLNEVCYNAH